MQRKRSRSRSASSVNLLELEQRLPRLPPWYVRVTIYGVVVGCFVMVFFIGPDSMSRVSEMSLLGNDEKTDAPYPAKLISWDQDEDVAGEMTCFETTTQPSFRMCARKDVDYEIQRQSWVEQSEYGKQLKTALEMFPNSGFVDVGANVGFFTLYSAKLGKQVLCIEPFADNVVVLKDTARMNELDSKITIIQNAITSGYEKIPFSNPQDKKDNAENHQPIVYADSITMNDIAKYATFKEAILRLDVGGQECTALEKANIFFKKINVHQIFMDWETSKNDKKDENCVKNMIQLLKAETYNPFLLNGERLKEEEWQNWKDIVVIWKREN